MSVALSKAFSTAMNGKCSNKPELVNTKMPFEIKISVLPAPKGGETLIRTLFEPLGYQLNIKRHILDDNFQDWGQSKYYTVELKNTITAQELLQHLYLLIPALDNDKHYYVSQNEIEKLLDKGKGWLSKHPEMEEITKRYLINLGALSRQAINRLNEDENTDINNILTQQEKTRKETLHQKRLNLVLEQLKQSKAESVIDLGCGEGKLIRLMLKEKQFKRITGTDVSYSELTRAKDKLHWDEMAPRQKERITLFLGALTYKDKRLEGYDAAAIVEVIEHLDENRLKAFERVVFEFAQPKTVVLTTPNSEYNVMYQSMKENTMRHTDHRFEWSRSEFEKWATDVAKHNNYKVNFLPVGEEDSKVGAPSQMAIFRYGN